LWHATCNREAGEALARGAGAFLQKDGDATMKKKMLWICFAMLAASAIVTALSYVSAGAGNNDAALNGADTAWVSVAAALVMLMTPALGFFYGGLVRSKNVVSTIMQCLITFAVATGVWTLWGYSLAFAPSIGGVIGTMKHAFLNGVGTAPDKGYAGTIPAMLYYFFQLKFAAITPALIIGAFAERIRFRSLLVFIVLWTTFVYAPAAHWVWGVGGWLRNLGVLDFAGGTVVHVLAGASALASALVIGRRTGRNSEARPNNVPFVILGAALLWFGWFGFNAGSALAVNGVAVNALVTTNIAAAFACLSWMAVDWFLWGKPSATGAATGAVCGLVAITPAAGFVDSFGAIVIGLMAGMICNFTVLLMDRTALDDTLDVFACHGVGGIFGAIATGLFARKLVNPAGADGLLYGNPMQLLLQVAAVAVTALWAFAMSVVLLKIIDWAFGLRVTPEEEEIGLDLSQHGETAYCND
jgi:ammonium transporter, Amt family